jgi:hypothetical protein
MVTSHAVDAIGTSNVCWISGRAIAIMVEFSGASVVPIAIAGSIHREGSGGCSIPRSAVIS